MKLVKKTTQNNIEDPFKSNPYKNDYPFDRRNNSAAESNDLLKEGFNIASEKNIKTRKRFKKGRATTVEFQRGAFVLHKYDTYKWWPVPMIKEDSNDSTSLKFWNKM